MEITIQKWEIMFSCCRDSISFCDTSRKYALKQNSTCISFCFLFNFKIIAKYQCERWYGGQMIYLRLLNVNQLKAKFVFSILRHYKLKEHRNTFTQNCRFIYIFIVAHDFLNIHSICLQTPDNVYI
jgi:hypothetical protein